MLKTIAKQNLATNPMWFGLLVLVALYATKAIQEAVVALAIVQGV